MKQKAKNIDFRRLFDDFLGELGRQRLQKESPKSHASVEDSSWNKHGSKMKQKGAKGSKKLNTLIFHRFFDVFWGLPGGPSSSEPDQARPGQTEPSSPRGSGLPEILRI